MERVSPHPASPPGAPPPPRAPSAARVITLTPAALIDRHAATHDVLETRPLAALAAAAAPLGEPLRAVLEWSDGAPAWELDAPDRDAMLACLAAAVAGAGLGPLHTPPRRTAPLDAAAWHVQPPLPASRATPQTRPTWRPPPPPTWGPRRAPIWLPTEAAGWGPCFPVMNHAIRRPRLAAAATSRRPARPHPPAPRARPPRGRAWRGERPH